MFLFKKITAPFLLPLSICLEILLFGLFLLWLTRRQKTGKLIISTGFILLAVISYRPIPNMFLRSMESKYLPIMDTSAFQGIKWVVVLGGGHCADSKLSITDQLSAASLVRLIEGIRLHRTLSNSKLLLSGGSAFSSTSEAGVMSKMAMVLGTDKNELVLESESKDTKDQANFIHNIIGKEKFLLVTSASHMTRSMALFQSKGMNPIPAPTGYGVKQIQKINPSMFFPSAKEIDKMEKVVYEYLGITWAGLRGQI